MTAILSHWWFKKNQIESASFLETKPLAIQIALIRRSYELQKMIFEYSIDTELSLGLNLTSKYR